MLRSESALELVLGYTFNDTVDFTVGQNNIVNSVHDFASSHGPMKLPATTRQSISGKVDKEMIWRIFPFSMMANLDYAEYTYHYRDSLCKLVSNRLI